MTAAEAGQRLAGSRFRSRPALVVSVWLDLAAVAATLLLPAALLHARAGADALIGLIDALFLLGCVLRGEWGWLRSRWVLVAGAWWGWLLLCSVPGIGIGGWQSLSQAIAVVRFPLLVAALEFRFLQSSNIRRWLWRIIAACCAYIAAHALWQAATGRNLYGWPRYGDGELTGPFAKPRAGAPLARLMFPALIPTIHRLMGRAGRGRAAAFALTLAAVAVIVLIGQRMPVALTVLGLLICGGLLPRLRPVLVASVAAGAGLLIASAAFYPAPYYRLVTKFSSQMHDFPASDYGRIFGRALVIAGQHPLFGRGFDGFRNACPDPSTFHAWSPSPGLPADGGGAAMCNIHPHNHYLQVLTDSGVPGLLLFVALNVAWLVRLGGGVGRPPDPLRVGLLAATVMQVWPLASASSYAAVEISGIAFLLLGWGLAEVRFGAQAAGARQVAPIAGGVTAGGATTGGVVGI